MNKVFGDKPQPPGRRASIALAVAVHVLLAAFLIYGIRWQSQRPEAVEVELVRSVPVPAAAAPAPAPKPEPKPEPPPKPEPKPEPKPLPPPKPDIAVKEKEKPKPKEAPKPTPDPIQDMLKREEKELAARQQQAAQQAAADKELAALKSSQANAARDKAAADYLSRIRAKIRGNIVQPPGIKGNPEAIFDVTQLPSGEILSVRLRSSSGSQALDDAIERAIRKSSPLPKPGQSDLFSRSLELKVRPFDE